MNARLLICMLCVSPMGWSAAAGEAPRGIGAYVEPGTRYFNLEGPQSPPLERDLDRWARILGASEAQRHFMGIVYRRFVERHNAYMDREAPSYLRLCADLAELSDLHGMSSHEYQAAARELDRRRGALLAGVEAIEQELVSSFAPVLTLEQLERLPTVRHDVTRRLCRANFAPGVRWTDIELREVWESSVAELASADESEAVAAILADYEVQLTALICRWDRLLIERRQGLRANRIAAIEGSVSTQEARERYLRLMEERHASGAAVRDLNKRTVSEVAGALTDSLASQFVAAARRAEFPELYPDTFALHAVLAALLNDEMLSESERDTVDALAAAYRETYDRLTAELEDFVEQWGDQASRGVGGYQPQYLRGALEPLLVERNALSRRIARKLDEAIGPSWRRRHSAKVPSALLQGDVRAETVESLRTP